MWFVTAASVFIFFYFLLEQEHSVVKKVVLYYYLLGIDPEASYRYEYLNYLCFYIAIEDLFTSTQLLWDHIIIVKVVKINVIHSLME